jgi:DNA-binding transcriptional ArsR family regulator
VSTTPAEPLAEEEFVAALKALANPMRVRILGWLKDPEGFPPQLEPAQEVGVCLKHIQARAGVSQSTASQYMATLQGAGLVTCTRIGQWTHYRRDEDRIEQLAAHIRAAL